MKIKYILPIILLLPLTACVFGQKSLSDINRGVVPVKVNPYAAEQKKRPASNIAALPGGRPQNINGNTVYIYDRPTNPNIPVYHQTTVSGGYVPSFFDVADFPHKNWGITAMGLDNVSYTGAGITVAVLDSGVVQHEQFCPGLVDILNISGVDYDYDAYGHGTAVAGIIGGCGPEGSGFAGVAPRVKMKVYKITDNKGSTNNINIERAVERILEHNRLYPNSPISIINISYGLSADDETVKNALKAAYDAGIVIVAPAGNDGKEALAYPAAYDFVIAVGGLRPSRKFFDMSNYGAGLAFTAPASAIYAPSIDGYYSWVKGTSFAAPYITGMAALVQEAYKKQHGALPSPKKVYEILVRISVGQEGLTPQFQGYGLPDASKIEKAVRLL